MGECEGMLELVGTIASEHIDEFVKGSAISMDVLRRAGIRSEYHPKAASKLLGRPWKEWESRMPAWIVPYRIPFQRDPVLYRGKPIRPFERRRPDGSVETQKYVQPASSGTHLYFGPSALDPAVLSDVSIPLWIVEGEKKCLSGESHGLCCVAVPGVSQWRVRGTKKLHPYLLLFVLAGREVFLCFDADALDNKDVRREELALARALEAAGAIVRIVRLPKDAKGLDDFFATHERTELDTLIADARAYQIPVATTAPDSDEWRAVWPHMRLDHDTERPIKDVDNIARVLIYHPAWQGVFGYDARWERQTVLKPPPFEGDLAGKQGAVPRAMSDADITRIGAWFTAQKPLGWAVAPKTVSLEAAIALVCDNNRFDAVQTYLMHLTWDGVSRLDDGAARYFGAVDTPYHRAVFSKWMLSAVERARHPGCQVDHVLILEGPQGTLKSSALRVLAGDAHFSDALPELGTKEALEHCLGPWILELSELTQVNRAEVETLKAFITAREPSFRHAYARRTTSHPRRCVFAGTTNSDTYLKDTTGNRRFWPLKCGTIDLEALRTDRDQLWAEALVRVRAGEAWHITDPAVLSVVAEAQADRRMVDPWVELVANYCSGRDRVTITEIAAYLGMTADRVDQRAANRIAATLRELGWVRRRVRVPGGLAWAYLLPFVPSVTTTGNILGTSQTPKNVEPDPLFPVFPVRTEEQNQLLNYPDLSTVKDADSFFTLDRPGVGTGNGEEHPGGPQGSKQPDLTTDSEEGWFG